MNPGLEEKKAKPLDPIYPLHPNQDQAVSHKGGEIDLRFLFETESIPPFFLDTPGYGRNHALHPRNPEPPALPGKPLPRRQIVGQAGSLPLESSFRKHDSILGVDLENFPNIAQGDRVKIPQLKGVAGLNGPEPEDFVRSSQGKNPKRVLAGKKNQPGEGQKRKDDPFPHDVQKKPRIADCALLCGAFRKFHSSPALQDSTGYFASGGTRARGILIPFSL
jgi:hypothetical protein